MQPRLAVDSAPRDSETTAVLNALRSSVASRSSESFAALLCAAAGFVVAAAFGRYAHACDAFGALRGAWTTPAFAGAVAVALVPAAVVARRLAPATMLLLAALSLALAGLAMLDGATGSIGFGAAEVAVKSLRLPAAEAAAAFALSLLPAAATACAVAAALASGARRAITGAALAAGAAFASWPPLRESMEVHRAAPCIATACVAFLAAAIGARPAAHTAERTAPARLDTLAAAALVLAPLASSTFLRPLADVIAGDGLILFLPALAACGAAAIGLRGSWVLAAAVACTLWLVDATARTGALPPALAGAPSLGAASLAFAAWAWASGPRREDDALRAAAVLAAAAVLGAACTLAGPTAGRCLLCGGAMMFLIGVAWRETRHAGWAAATMLIGAAPLAIRSATAETRAPHAGSMIQISGEATGAPARLSRALLAAAAWSVDAEASRRGAVVCAFPGAALLAARACAAAGERARVLLDAGAPDDTAALPWLASIPDAARVEEPPLRALRFRPEAAGLVLCESSRRDAYSSAWLRAAAAKLAGGGVYGTLLPSDPAERKYAIASLRAAFTHAIALAPASAAAAEPMILMSDAPIRLDAERFGALKASAAFADLPSLGLGSFDRVAASLLGGRLAMQRAAGDDRWLESTPEVDECAALLTPPVDRAKLRGDLEAAAAARRTGIALGSGAGAADALEELVRTWTYHASSLDAASREPGDALAEALRSAADARPTLGWPRLGLVLLERRRLRDASAPSSRSALRAIVDLRRSALKLQLPPWARGAAQLAQAADQLLLGAAEESLASARAAALELPLSPEPWLAEEAALLKLRREDDAALARKTAERLRLAAESRPAATTQHGSSEGTER